MIIIIEKDDLAAFSFILGCVIGSFLNVLILRLPLGLCVIKPRSKCMSCKHTISWYYNIPLLSFLFLKGKCAYCSSKISLQYFIVEFISAVLTYALFIKLGLSLEFIFTVLLIYVFITLCFIDFAYKAVPDYLLLIILILSFFVSSYSLLDSLTSAFILAGAFVLLNFIVSFYIQNIKAKILKDDSLKTQEALGEGDIPVIAAIAAILGVQGAMIAMFLSAIFAIIPSLVSNYFKKDIQTAFIPYLFLAFLVEYFLSLSKLLN